MNWNTNEFIWLDWAVLGIGVVAIIWAVYRAIEKDKRRMKGADSQDYLFGKGEPWYVIGAAIFAANIGSEHLVGLAGTGAKDGVGMAHWERRGHGTLGNAGLDDTDIGMALRAVLSVA